MRRAVGIGTLLEDGLGDTVRVSLTEEPEFEIPVAKALVDRYASRTSDSIPKVDKNPINPYDYTRRHTKAVKNIGDHNVPVVMADFSLKSDLKKANFFGLGYGYSVDLDKWNISDQACDYVFVGNNNVEFNIPGTLGIVQTHKTWLENKSKQRHYPFLNKDEFMKGELSSELNFVYACLPDLKDEFITKLKSDSTAVLLIDTYNDHGMAEQRRMFIELVSYGLDTPVILGRAYANLTPEDLQLNASTDLGALLLDGLGDGLFIAAENCGSDQSVNQLGFGILQATRTRISKTEYISCPSCGRTLFDLQETTASIRKRTSHLKGLKIGIMGCGG